MSLPSFGCWSMGKNRIPYALFPALLLSVALLTGCTGKDAPKEQKNASAPHQASTEANEPPKPHVRPAVVSIEAGKKIYEAHCHYCHGQRGAGDGPVSIAITPHPADFVHDTKRMSKTDSELFESVSKGIRREIGGDEMAMPRWQDVLTEQQRWDVLAYVRHLAEVGNAKH